MNIRKKTRGDLSIALYFHKPLINLTDIALVLYLYDTWGENPKLFDAMDLYKREFDNYSEVSEIVREFINAGKRDTTIESKEKTSAQKVKDYIENEKIYTRLAEAGESEETIGKVRRVQKVFQGRFLI